MILLSEQRLEDTLGAALMCLMAWGVGRETVESPPGVRGRRARDRMGQCPKRGSWPEGLWDTGVRESQGLRSPLPELLNLTWHLNKERGPWAHPLLEELLTWTERGTRTFQPPRTRKSGTEVAPETTTPTRLWGSLAYYS